ncbi:grx4 family monothiol glutaredoxin [Plasmopara halstedii]|uniref:Grx4 family monothiol glutaredoxin n=1 Tax=Plasmopara halstedii TaxID=4781 RepID=A0A0P1A9V6_PLAHL|nr:grx4 family monothiol glutaredoxin [Plasmopara halstedii]CEG37520.1 grx4 family monothiol glutaredoxin [Plasmopara halstedii]|eukprot:XP_024573889.1 grx4 family monothiol glutaredoxin [Plasmopara halstedii]
MAAVTGSVVIVQSIAQFDEATARESTISVTFFWADFHDACRPNGQLDVVVRQLATLHPRIRFFKVAAEELPELSERFQIEVVPTFVIAQGRSVLDKLENANVADLAKRVDVLSKSVVQNSTLAATTKEPAKALDEALQYRLQKLISASPVMLFMKGNPSEPKCGFSRQIVALLNDEKIQFGSFDILNDDQVRQGLKEYSNWPTYPQLYVNGKLVGGLDILNEMKSEGSIAEQLKLKKNVEEAEAAFEEGLRALVNSAPVLLFMKGTPSEPKCGFSQKTVKLLREHEIAFSSFDILSDDQVRQGLKKFSNWPTYPQLYVKGKLIGGLDILNEMAEDGDLSEQLGVDKKTKKENKYHQLINRARVMIFIKGTPKQPQCGFSRKLVEILDTEGFKYDYFDILSDDSIRQGLKKYSNWPTFPQLYVNGELIGGLDIVQQLQEDGELEELKE